MKFLDWLKSLFSKKAVIDEADRFDVYKPSDRMIYEYFDGKQQVRRDPIVLYRKISEVGQELSVDIRAANSKLSNTIAMKGHESVIKKVKTIFGVTSFEEGGGLTEVELMSLLDHFLFYCDAVKKNLNPLTTSQTEVSSPTEPTSAETPPIVNTSDSGSTASEGSSGKSTSPPAE